jgi:hypothetical protein
LVAALSAAFSGAAGLGAVVHAAEIDPEVVKAFDVFHKEWVERLRTQGDYGPNKVQVEKDSSGRYSAKYRVLEKVDSTEVKSSGDKLSPYVGLLRYEESVFASYGDSPDQARQGPFVSEKQVVITEIFRYSKGKWIY